MLETIQYSLPEIVTAALSRMESWNTCRFLQICAQEHIFFKPTKKGTIVRHSVHPSLKYLAQFVPPHGKERFKRLSAAVAVMRVIKRTWKFIPNGAQLMKRYHFYFTSFGIQSTLASFESYPADEFTCFICYNNAWMQRVVAALARFNSRYNIIYDEFDQSYHKIPLFGHRICAVCLLLYLVRE